jgi:hypothetical protein
LLHTQITGQLGNQRSTRFDTVQPQQTADVALRGMRADAQLLCHVFVAHSP